MFRLGAWPATKSAMEILDAEEASGDTGWDQRNSESGSVVTLWITSMESNGCDGGFTLFPLYPPNGSDIV